MKLPDFNMNEASWDAWSAFHINHYPFVQFDTGELVYTEHWSRPRRRKMYKDLNVRIIGTADYYQRAEMYTYKTPDGESVPDAWLNQSGATQLLLDFDTNRAVGTLGKEWTERIPLRFEKRDSVSVYFPGPGKAPIGRMISLSRPRVFTREEKEKIREIIRLCRTWDKLTSEDATWRSFRPRTIINDGFLNLEFNKMDDREKLSIARGRFETQRILVEVPYLTF